MQYNGGQVSSVSAEVIVLRPLVRRIFEVLKDKPEMAKPILKDAYNEVFHNKASDYEEESDFEKDYFIDAVSLFESYKGIASNEVIANSLRWFSYDHANSLNLRWNLVAVEKFLVRRDG